MTKVKMVFILSDKNLTLETNSSSAPAKVITLLAGVPQCWNVNEPAANNPFGTTNVTSLFATNGSATEIANLKVRCLVDPT